MTNKTYAFETLFFAIDRDMLFGCECCGGDAIRYYQLQADPRAAYVCRACGEQYVSELNDGMWEDDALLYEY